MASKAWLPYEYRYLESLPCGERLEAVDLAHSYNRCMGRSGRFSASKMDRLVSYNAKGAMIANTNGPAWFDREEQK